MEKIKLLIAIPLVAFSAVGIYFILTELFPSFLYAPDALFFLLTAVGVYFIVIGVKRKSSKHIILGFFLFTFSISPGIMFILALYALSTIGIGL